MIGAMPFAAELGLEVVDAAGGTAAVTLARSRAVSWNEDSFQAAFVALVADLAAGAAAATVIGAEEFPLTTDIDVAVLAATRGERLVADAHVLAHVGRSFVVATTVRVHRAGNETVCGAGTVKLRIVTP